MSKSDKTLHAVVAAVRDDTHFKAVELRKRDGAIEVLWAKSMSADEKRWSDFAVACGFATDAETLGKTPRRSTPAVVGLGSTAVAFYRISVPAVGEEETAAVVRMQAESLLPLPPEQIEVAWRTTPLMNGQVDVTLAAARRDHLQQFADRVRAFRPTTIWLSCEGTAEGWRRLFSDQEQQAAVIQMGGQNTQVCLIRDGLVAHAAVLATGMNDVVHTNDGSDPSQRAEVMERFAQDLRTVLESFDASGTWPVLVLSDGSDAIDRVVMSLNTAGLYARASLPDSSGVAVPPDFGVSDLYTYCTPLGLALMALERPATALRLFEGIRRDGEEAEARRRWRSAILAGVAAAIMLVALVVVCYATDVARERQLTELAARPDVEQATQRQALLKTVARRRPDMLQLLAQINSEQIKGIILDRLHFKKGQPVNLIGRADNEEQLWKYQESLRGRKSLQAVEITAVSKDAKTKKIKFTLTFQYGSFTKKSATL